MPAAVPPRPPVVVVAPTTNNGILGNKKSIHNNADTTDDDAPRRKTHIEVCVRLRPLSVSDDTVSDNSFFNPTKNRQQQRRASSSDTAAARQTMTGRSTYSSSRLARLHKSHLPRGPASRRTGSSLPVTTPARKPAVPTHHETSPTATTTTTTSSAASSSSDPLLYAWEVRSSEGEEDHHNNTMTQSSQTDLVPGRTHAYTFDRVYGAPATNGEIYQHSVSDLVKAAMQGYHTSVLAYGQTSTGKTHTMSGSKEHPGLIPLSVRECFDFITKQQQDQQQQREYLLRISYLEVYKEHIRDLLASSTSSTATSPPVRLFDSAEGLIIKGLTEQVVTSPEQVFACLQQGESRRQVGATHLNQHSSRSHVIVRLWIESKAVVVASSSSGQQQQQQTNNGMMSTTSSVSSEISSSSTRGVSSGGVRISSLSLVDLAGSESVRLTGSSDRRQEGHYINKSLMTLGLVVHALSESAEESGGGAVKKHVPYRDSKLTRLLQPSLSGNAQVVLICCISPLVSHIEESHNTFKFALRAKKIPQKATIHESVDDKTLLQSYREEIEDLKQQLKDMRQQQDRIVNKNKDSTSSDNNVSMSDIEEEVDDLEIKELVKSIRTMEKLILKGNTQTLPSPINKKPEDLLDSFDEGAEGDDDDDSDLMALAAGDIYSAPLSTPLRSTMATPVAAPLTIGTHDDDDTTDGDLRAELTRMQDLLGSVFKKRGATSPLTNNMSRADSVEEVRDLRAQLEQQEVATALRTADSSFLQTQLAEKDKLLEEVSKILEAVEARQLKLEQENASLRKELELYKQQSSF